MKPQPETTAWSRQQRLLHWWVAGIVFCQFALQGPMRAAMAAIAQDQSISFSQFLVTTVHVWGGTLVLALTLYRIHLRKLRPVPVGAGKLSTAHARIALLTHRLLLLAVLLMGVSGLAHWYVGMELAAKIHEVVKWLLGGLLCLHVCGALWHRLKERG